MAEEPRPGGTGFFLRHVEPTGPPFVYAVTARHNIEAIVDASKDGFIHLRVNVRDGGCRLVQTKKEDWLFHPSDSEADVAVLPLEGLLLDEVDLLFFPMSGVGTPEVISQEAVGPGDEVAIAGLFKSHYGARRNVPVIRMGHIAAMPDEPVTVSWPDRQNPRPMQAYLLDTRSIGGLSGSPVFVKLPSRPRPEIEQKGEFYYLSQKPGSVFYLLGLVHGHWEVPVPELDAGVEEDTARGRANAGLAIVVPGMKILEAVNQPTLIKRRQAILREATPGAG